MLRFITTSQAQIFDLAPTGEFIFDSPVFSVAVDKIRNEEQSSAFPVIPAEASCHFVAIMPETAIRGMISFSEFEWDSGAFAVVPGIRTAEITVAGLRPGAWTESTIGSREWSPDAWNRNGEPEFRLAAEGAALHRYSITVNGMTEPAHRGRSHRGWRFGGRVAEALPTGRIICLQHQQLNL